MYILTIYAVTYYKLKELTLYITDGIYKAVG